MPLYTYECQCGDVRDLFSQIDDRDSPRICEGCGQEMKRKLSKPGMISKTGGGYAF